jgi:hypothetical protein
MKLLAYISEYKGSNDFIENDLKQINVSAKKRNKILDITGVLFYQNNLFLQIMEGPDQNVDHLMNIIKQDSRHKNIQFLIQYEVHKRDFSEWNMEQFNLSKDTTINKNQILQFTDVYKANVIPKAKELAELYKDIIAC